MVGTPARNGLFAAVITFVILAVVMNVQARGWLAWYRLAAAGEHTAATIISQNPKFHDICGFEYVIGAQRYSGSQSGCGLSVGETTEVVYLPSEPAFATLSSPTSELLFRIGAPLLLALLAGALSAWRTPREAPRL